MQHEERHLYYKLAVSVITPVANCPPVKVALPMPLQSTASSTLLINYFHAWIINNSLIVHIGGHERGPQLHQWGQFFIHALVVHDVFTFWEAVFRYGLTHRQEQECVHMVIIRSHSDLTDQLFKAICLWISHRHCTDDGSLYTYWENTRGSGPQWSFRLRIPHTYFQLVTGTHWRPLMLSLSHPSHPSGGWSKLARVSKELLDKTGVFKIHLVLWTHECKMEVESL